MFTVLLTACAPQEQASPLAQKLLFTAHGTYDAQADERERLGGGLRRIYWQKSPPLNAETVTVRYDSEGRQSNWEVNVQGPRFTPEELVGTLAPVTLPQGKVFRPATGALGKTVIVPFTGGFRVVSHGFAVQQEPSLLPAFQ